MASLKLTKEFSKTMFDKETITNELQNRLENAKPRDNSLDISDKLNEVIENQEYEYDEEAGVPVPVGDGDEDSPGIDEAAESIADDVADRIDTDDPALGDVQLALEQVEEMGTLDDIGFDGDMEELSFAIRDILQEEMGGFGN